MSFVYGSKKKCQRARLEGCPGSAALRCHGHVHTVLHRQHRPTAGTYTTLISHRRNASTEQVGTLLAAGAKEELVPQGTVTERSSGDP